MILREVEHKTSASVASGRSVFFNIPCWKLVTYKSAIKIIIAIEAVSRLIFYWQNEHLHNLTRLFINPPGST